MNSYGPSVCRQGTIEIVPTSRAPDEPGTSGREQADPRTAPAPAGLEASAESIVLRTTATSETGPLGQWEAGEYRGLEDALSSLVQLDDGDDWKIERSAYDAACYIAAGLVAGSFPAPRVFTHGPKSVVFNWSERSHNLYLTVCGDRISALISSPERIEARIDYSMRDLSISPLMLPSIRAAFSQSPVRRLVSGAALDAEGPLALS